MWTAEHTIVTDVSKEAIWKVWKDIENWKQWDEGLEWCRFNGEFKTGVSYTLKPKGGSEVQSTISECEPLKKFSDVTKLPLAKLEFVHELNEEKDGLHVTHRVVISGLLSFFFAQVIGKDTARNFPKTISNLIRVAKESK
ncbi:MAG: Polyketide cyclase / dehydrase and lipid transport [Chloroflexi bacterium OLB14]|nr:MAG: Polyketide cyclase / dehydrase and lipid transport [Chloroflexi bacterium OLB14]